MQVRIDGKRVRLNPGQVIGAGGEATVFAYAGSAVKIYQTPNPARAQKLRALVTACVGLPDQVVAPQQLVFDAAGKEVIGFTMRLLESDYSEVRWLANRAYRAQSGIDARGVTNLFLQMHATLTAIHQAKMVVGDLNDLNLMFRGGDVLFIDVDSFQFGGYPCMVGTEAFLPPELYGVDLAAQPAFQPQHDWYAFAVLLCKALLLVHPYGGVHPTIKLLTQRALQRVSVFNTGVTYPRIAYRPELLSDELAQVFVDWFDRGCRDIFPAAVLAHYRDSLRDCPSCGAVFPAQRPQCPLCSVSSPVVLPAAQMAGAQTLVAAGGQIVSWFNDGRTLSVLAHEAGSVVLYRFDRQRTQRLSLFDALPDATYALMGDNLIIAPDRRSDTLLMVDVSGGQPAGLLRTTTQLYSGQQPMFGANARSLYRLAGNYLMRGRFESGHLVEQPIMTAATGQTWFRVSPTDDHVVGYFRVLAGDNAQVDYRYWLLVEDRHIDLTPTPLSAGEVLLETAVYFDAASVLLARCTLHNGTQRLYLDELAHTGEVLFAQVRLDSEADTPLTGWAYRRGVLLRPTDAGILQERLYDRTSRLFQQTEPFVREGDWLDVWEDALVSVHDGRVVRLAL